MPTAEVGETRIVAGEEHLGIWTVGTVLCSAEGLLAVRSGDLGIKGLLAVPSGAAPRTMGRRMAPVGPAHLPWRDLGPSQEGTREWNAFPARG